MPAAEELLPPAVLRQIGDKLYEKRKAAALEVEQVVKRLAAHNDQHRLRLIIDKLISEYAFSNQANARKVMISVALQPEQYPHSPFAAARQPTHAHPVPTYQHTTPASIQRLTQLHPSFPQLSPAVPCRNNRPPPQHACNPYPPSPT